MSIEADEKEISIHVVDEGSGFTPEDHKNIFGKFQKLSARPTNKETSTGLGLYIVKCIADAHGGSILAENAHNGGAHMVFSWPGIST
jgi:K+-sensing histidine kinase KdpD